MSEDNSTNEFIMLCLESRALRFAKLTLKSGRVTPYYFDGGRFTTGTLVTAIGKMFAKIIVDSGVEFDVLFGPAFKGIPIVVSTAIALAERGLDVPWCYNRMRAKEFAEGGRLVGADVTGKRVLILDDVVSGGDSIRASIAQLTAAGGILAGVVVALDRQELATDGSGQAPSVAIAAKYGVPFLSIINLDDCTLFVDRFIPPGADVELGDGLGTLADLLAEMQGYKAKWGMPTATTS